MTTEERLKKFEKELSRYRRLLAVVTLGIGVCVAAWVFSPQMLLAQPATDPLKEVRAMSFVLVDKNDKTRSVLGFEETGDASLRFLDVNGMIRFGISVGDESVLAILDKNGKVRVDMGVNNDDESSLALKNGSGKPRFVIFDGDEGPGLAILDKNGKVRVDMRVNNDDESSLALRDGSGKPRFVIFDRNDHSLMLTMLDESQTTRTVLGLDKDGPVLSLYGKNAQATVGLGVDKDEVSRIVMIDKDGKVRWSAP